MAAAIDLNAWLNRRRGTPWLVGLDSHRFWQALENRLKVLVNHRLPSPQVLLAESDPLYFLAGAVAAIAHGSPLILANPAWGDQEWQQVKAILSADLVWGITPELNCSGRTPLEPGSILIPTGGSSGQVKFAVHTWATLSASVDGFQQHFAVTQVNAYCVLPLYHVSGFMQMVRVLTTDGMLAVQTFKNLVAGQPLRLASPAFLSLVPTQLKRLLTLPRFSWGQFEAVLLGGAPTWPELLQQARDRRLPLALTYGMSETAALVAALRPTQFLAGETGVVPMPHAAIAIRDAQGRPQPSGRTGHLCIQAKSLHRGYWPPQDTPTECTPAEFTTDDLGYFDAAGHLHVVGRASTKIISGGENVFPAEVEAAIAASGLVEDVCVLGLPDADWGEVVVAIVVTTTWVGQIPQAIESTLSRYKQPKHWIVLPAMPRNLQGKINRADITRLAEDILRLEK